jgi:hypothetical protein
LQPQDARATRPSIERALRVLDQCMARRPRPMERRPVCTPPRPPLQLLPRPPSPNLQRITTMDDSEPVRRRRTRLHRLRKNSLASRMLGRARLRKLRKSSDSRGFWEGHDFSCAVKSLKMCPRFSARGGLFALRRLFPQPRSSNGTFGIQYMVFLS